MTTRFFYDTEFIEDGETIDLVSIGIVRDDGRTYYAISEDHRPELASQWVEDNVLDQLPDRSDSAWKPLDEIAFEVAVGLQAGGPIELWADYGAYDHVALCQLFGTMMDLPSHVPMFTHEFQQEWERAGKPKLPTQEGDEHNALADALYLKRCFDSLTS